MAEAAAPSLGDFFKAKSKKKVKASNLNKAEEKKTEEKKKTSSKEDDAWQEDEVVAATIKVEVAGKLMREEEKKDDEEAAAPAWNVSKKESASAQPINEKRYPTLAKSNKTSSIDIDDGSDAKVNITTSKNRFADLEGEDDEDNSGNKRPKSIMPSMVTKKQGEREKVALAREVEKYTSKPSKKKAKKSSDAEDDDEEDDEEDEDAEAEDGDEAAPDSPKLEEVSEKKPKKPKEAKKPVEEEEEDQEEVEEDLKIQVDLVESKEKYKGRKKLPPKDLPRSELEEEKENKPKQQNASGKKKKFVEEETEKKLEYADW